MVTNLTDDQLEEIYAKSKKKFGCSKTGKISYDGIFETAYIDMTNFDIKINPNFIKTIVERGLDEKTTLEAIIDHEVSHYKEHPFHLKTVILENIEAMKHEHGIKLKALYDDLINNIRAIQKYGAKDIASVYKNLADQNNDALKVLSAFYADYFGYKLDFGIKKEDLSPELAKKVDMLYIISFDKLDEQTNIKNFKIFISIMEDIVSNSNNKIDELIDIDNFDPNDVNKTLKRMVEDGEISKDDYKKILSKYKSPSDPKLYKEGDIEWYRIKSATYNMKIKPPLTNKDGGEYPNEHRKFELDDEIKDFDPFTSPGGKCIPGLAYKWVRDTNFNTYAIARKINNAIIYIDSSKSMLDPIKENSPAVLAGFVAARAYLLNNSKVGVINFSDETYVLEFTDRCYEIYKQLIKYQGGNTRINLEKLFNFKNKSKQLENKNIDHIVITDTKIENINGVLSYFDESVKLGDRVYIFWTADIDTKRINEEHPKLHLKKCLTDDDLGKIILDEVII